jgi:vacuolar protein sorting-associated protein 41
MAEESEDQGDKKVPKDEESNRDETDTVDDEEETVDSDAEEEEDDEGEEEEPKLKYARLSSHLVPVYRNGDATSSFLVAGDKMVSVDGSSSLKPY